MRAEELLEAIGEIDISNLDGARPEKKGVNRRAIWGTAAAALAAAAMLGLALLAGRTDAPGKVDAFTTEAVGSLDDITENYDGTLLAENLIAAGADISDIQLEHREDTDVSDASGWKKLTLTAENGGEQMRMTCTFGAPEGFYLPEAPDETIEYAGVTVWLYLDSSVNGAGETEYTCRAVFISDGVVYDMDFYLYTDNDLDSVYEYLAMVLGPEDGRTPDGTAENALRPLESIMGFTDYKVTADVNHLGSTWHFWLDVDGVETCVAEVTGDIDYGIYSVDLDGDGTPEVVANNVYGDGVQEVKVFNYSDGKFYVGTISDDYYDELGFVTWEWAHAVSEEYDPEKNVFVVENHPQSAGERTETFTGIEPFAFRRFANSPGDHFDTRPLSYDELEPTDIRPLPDLYGDTDYKVGIERTEKADVWHFWKRDGTKLTCLAEATAKHGETPEVYSVDLDGDGENEFIANDKDGTVKAISYSNGWPESEVWEYTVSGDRLFGLQSHGPDGSGKVTERYDPEENEFVLTVTGWGDDEPAYTETFTGLDFGSHYAYHHELYGDVEYIKFENVTPEPDENLPDIPGREKLTAFTLDGEWEHEPTLEYSDRWTFFVKEDAHHDGSESRFYVRDSGTGKETDLTGPLEARGGSFRLTEFTDILGCDGVVLEYYDGASSAPMVFFRVDDGVSLLAQCDGDVYTGDINSDGINEIVYNTRGAYPFTYIYKQGDGVRTETAVDALRDVLTGERDFRYTFRSGEIHGTLNIEKAGETLTEGGSEWFEATDFALVDMDGDGTGEAVIQVSQRDGGYDEGYVVLRYNAGEVYGYLFYARGFIDLKQDGTFYGSSSSANTEYRRIDFDGLRLDENTFMGFDTYTNWDDNWQNDIYYGVGSLEEFSELMDEQNEKPNAQWWKLTEENIAAAFEAEEDTSAGAAESLRAVLRGDADFMSAGMDGKINCLLDIDHAGDAMTGGAKKLSAAKFAVLDMDGDGGNEVVLSLCQSDGAEKGFVVLRARAGGVYGYAFKAWELEELKSDGTFTFMWTEDEFDTYIDELTFSGTGVACAQEILYHCEDRYRPYTSVDERDSQKTDDEIILHQEAKPSAVWLDITEKNIESALGNH